jgi:Caspase domain
MQPPEGDLRLRPAAVAALGALVFSIGAGRVLADAVVRDASAPVERVGLHVGEGEAVAAPAEVGAGVEAAPPPAPVQATGERVIEPPPDNFDGAAAGPASCAARGAPQPGGGTWAVIVGVNNYPGGAHDLLASVNDAHAVDQALGRLGVPAANRLVLVDGQASGCGVRSALDWLVASAAPESTAVFFFAGHARLRGGGERVLVASDGSTITDDELGARLGRLRASRTWIALATCYGAGFTSVLGPGRILTGAAGAGELAYEAVGSERSYMVEYMVHRAIVGGAAPASVEAAYAYARVALDRAAPGRAPVQIDQAPGDLDLRPSPRVPLPPPLPGVGLPPAPVGPGPVVPGPVPVSPRPPVPTTLPCKPILGLLCFG